LRRRRGQLVTVYVVPVSTKIVLVAALAAAALGIVTPTAARANGPAVRTIRISYRAHDGLMRRAYVIVPARYGPAWHPALPLVISPHGRGVGAWANVRRWGRLPAVGDFAVVNPEGQGRALTLYSWGDPGEIRDLAHMPEIVSHALPWLRIDRHRIYAFGGSMGGQETLLLVAHHPHLLAGAAAFDAPTNMAARYRAFVHLPLGVGLQHLARVEVGGTPLSDPRAYASRSPLDNARRIAFSHVPLQIWWSTRDRIVTDQREESGLLYRLIKRFNPNAPVVEFVGVWAHTTEMKAHAYLPYALSRFGLLPYRPGPPPGGDCGPEIRPSSPGSYSRIFSSAEFRPAAVPARTSPTCITPSRFSKPASTARTRSPLCDACSQSSHSRRVRRPFRA
jgi:dienelactone hydrolase